LSLKLNLPFWDKLNVEPNINTRLIITTTNTARLPLTRLDEVQFMDDNRHLRSTPSLVTSNLVEVATPTPSTSMRRNVSLSLNSRRSELGKLKPRRRSNDKLFFVNDRPRSSVERSSKKNTNESLGKKLLMLNKLVNVLVRSS